MNEERPLRVISLIHPFRPVFSGEAEAWLRMIPALRKRGIEVEILTVTDGAATDSRSELVEETVVHRVAARQDVRWGRMRAIIATLIRRRKRFDVALFHSPNHDALYASCLLGRLLGWKTVYKMTLFGSDDCVTIRDADRLGRMRVATLRLADGLICMSEQLRRTVHQVGITVPKMLMATNGFDSARFRPADANRRRDSRQRLGIPENAKVVLFCGGIIRRKGVDILLQAWPAVTEFVADAQLVLAGPNHHDGFEEREYQEFSQSVEHQIVEEGLDRTVRLEGYQQAMENYYAAADLFVLPSRAEGWPSVINEAMASALPCVVSALDGTSDEHLRDGQDGVIVRSENPEEYAAAIIRLLTDKERARQMGRQARERAIERFDVERLAVRYAEFLRSVAGRALEIQTVAETEKASPSSRQAGETAVTTTV